MMGSPVQLTLGRPSTTMKSVAFRGVDDLERMRKVEHHLQALEDERKKIEAFKRELPFCMRLLRDAIEASKDQMSDCHEPPPKRRVLVNLTVEDDSNLKSRSGRPILEEFAPLKNKVNDSTLERITSDSQTGEKSNQRKFCRAAEAYANGRDMFSSASEKSQNRRETIRIGQDQHSTGAPKPVAGGAFLPFFRDQQPSAVRARSTQLFDLSLPLGVGEVSHGGESEKLFNLGRGSLVEEPNLIRRKEMPNPAVSQSSEQARSPPHRKARRCWSPELHRLFVNALQQLGGSQVATPKQIRELMKVDGLTNDEVKSHLQKYRLHTRRPHAAFQSAAPPQAPQLVVLGGIWVPPEYAAQAAAATEQATPFIYNSSLPFSQDHYTQLNVSPILQLHPSLYYDEQQAAAANSQSSSQGPLQLTAHSSGAVRDESMGVEDENEASSWRDEYQEERCDKADVKGGNCGGNLHANSCRYGRESGDDDSEGEDRRIYGVAM